MSRLPDSIPQLYDFFLGLELRLVTEEHETYKSLIKDVQHEIDQTHAAASVSQLTERYIRYMEKISILSNKIKLLSKELNERTEQCQN